MYKHLQRIQNNGSIHLEVCMWLNKYLLYIYLFRCSPNSQEEMCLNSLRISQSVNLNHRHLEELCNKKAAEYQNNHQLRQ